MTTKTICTCCGQTIRQPKLLQPAMPVDTSMMTEAELFAHCKRISTREDVRFFLRVCPSLPAELRAEGESLLATLEQRTAMMADKRALNSIRDRAAIARGYQTFNCGDPTHRHTIMLNAERCHENQELAAEQAALLAEVA